MRKFSWYTTKKSKNGMYYGIGLYNLDEGLFVKYKPNMKGGHTHNHVKNAHKRMRKCHICGEPIVWGCGEIGFGIFEFRCRSCWNEALREQSIGLGIPYSGFDFKTRKRRK